MLLLTVPATAQEGGAVDVDGELAFARGLAVEWGFLDLAEEVLKAFAAEAQGADATQLELARCSLFAEAARLERDPARRRELYDEALAGFERFLHSNPLEAERGRAEQEWLDAAYLYARYLERDLAEAAGEERAPLLARLEAVVTDALEVLNERSSVPGEVRAQHTARLMHGRLCALLGAQLADGDYWFDRAIEGLTELALETEGTPTCLYAYAEAGDVFAARGNWEEAAAYHGAVVELALPSDPSEWARVKDELELTAADVGVRFRFLERSAPALIDALRLAGNDAEATRHALHFLNTWNAEGVALSDDGEGAALRVAEVLLELGGHVGGDLGAGEARWFATEEELRGAMRRGREQRAAWEVALDLARRVQAGQPSAGRLLEVRRLYAAIERPPGAGLPAGLLVEAAEGELASGATASALGTVRGLLERLEWATEQEQLEFTVPAHHLLGRCLERQRRRTEAALAYREAVARRSGASPELELASARRFQRLVADWRRAARSDVDPLVRLLAEADESLLAVAAEQGGDEDVVAARRRDAEGLFARGQFAEAREVYRVLLADTGSELSRVMAAVCAYRAGPRALAADELEAYLLEATPSAAEANEQGQRSARNLRHHARGLARYFLAAARSEEARHADVVRLLTGYDADHPEQTDLVPAALGLLVEAHLAQGELEAADAAQAALDPTGAGFVRVTKALYNARRRALHGEAPAAKRAGLTRLIELLDALRDAGAEGFPELWNGALHAEELGGLEPDGAGDWRARAIRSLEALDGRFAGDAALEEKLVSQVRPKLGALYLAAGRVLDAHALLTPIVLHGEARPSKQAVVDWVRSTIGWLEGGGPSGTVTYTPGAAQDPALFQAAIDRLVRIRGARDVIRQGCESYSLLSEIVLAYYAWGQQDSARLDAARRQLARLQVDLGGDWALLDTLCEGDRVLGDRCRWLERVLR